MLSLSIKPVVLAPAHPEVTAASSFRPRDGPFGNFGFFVVSSGNVNLEVLFTLIKALGGRLCPDKNDHRITHVVFCQCRDNRAYQVVDPEDGAVQSIRDEMLLRTCPLHLGGGRLVYPREFGRVRAVTIGWVCESSKRAEKESLPSHLSLFISSPARISVPLPLHAALPADVRAWSISSYNSTAAIPVSSPTQSRTGIAIAPQPTVPAANGHDSTGKSISATAESTWLSASSGGSEELQGQGASMVNAAAITVHEPVHQADQVGGAIMTGKANSHDPGEVKGESGLLTTGSIGKRFREEHDVGNTPDRIDKTPSKRFRAASEPLMRSTPHLILPEDLLKHKRASCIAPVPVWALAASPSSTDTLSPIRNALRPTDTGNRPPMVDCIGGWFGAIFKWFGRA